MENASIRRLAAATLIALVAGHAHADWDAKLEAEEQAQRDRSAAVDRQRKAESTALLAAARIKAERAHLRKEAQGKTDAEVHVLYEAKVKRDNEESLRQTRTFDPKAALADHQTAMKRVNDPKQRAAADEGARVAGAMSFEDMKNKSPEELQKMLEAMERMAGKQR